MKRTPNPTAFLFGIYLLILVWVVLFKMTFSFSDISWFTGMRRINFIPFHYDIEFGNFHLKEVLANILAFVPLGIFLSMLGLSCKKAVISGCILSAAFELFQFTAAIGACDITDLITNTLGTTAGVCLYLSAQKLFKTKQRTDRIINVTASVVVLLFFVLVVLLITAN